MQKIRKNAGITLVSLIVTIIILMILAGVVIATVTGNNSILGKVKQAREKYQNSANEENNTLSKYENEIDKASIDVASSRDNISLNGIYKEIGIFKNEDKSAGTYTFDTYSREIKTNDIEYDNSSKSIVIKNSGWYIVEVYSGNSQSGWTMVYTNFLINEVQFAQVISSGNNGDDRSTSPYTLYLKSGTKISFNKEITPNSSSNWANSYIRIIKFE